MNKFDQANSPDVLADWVRDARGRTIALVDDLDDDRLIGPKLPTVNPLLWEIAHAAWFQEHWVLQTAAGRKPIRKDGHALFDSIGIAHETRWDLPLPSRAETLAYIERVRDEVVELLETGPLTDELIYFVKLSVFHEDMHCEAFTYTRQTHGYPSPGGVESGELRVESEAQTTRAGRKSLNPQPSALNTPRPTGDVEIAGGEFLLGAPREAAFVFDNEKWEHPVEVAPFRMAKTLVTQAEFAEFINDGGYSRPEFWSEDGWRWRCETDAEHPVYWRKTSGGEWQRRQFDRWLPLEPQFPVHHVNWYEADAYCHWAGRRLPSEAEWELAAAGFEKRHYPWGETPPVEECVNMDWRAGGVVDVAAHPAGDTPEGCRQMIGNVWEWTATTFEPYPGFAVDPYKEYSRPCFGECQVLRGGCWATPSRLIRNTWRNFYRPDRRDVFAGFRTCAR